MTLPEAGAVSTTDDASLTVTFDGVVHPAVSVARGAAYELFGADPGPGWLRNPRPGARWPFRRFVPAAEADLISGTPDAAEDAPLYAPVSRRLSWDALHALSQRPADVDSATIHAVRRTATVRRGTRMALVLPATALADYLHGALPGGFCYRESDIAHLRTPAELSVLGGDGTEVGVSFVLHWRATDGADFEVPVGPRFAGLVAMPTGSRVGPPVIGTGFAPSSHHLIPEFVTRDFADLPVPARASLVAYTPDGSEVQLYSYLAEQASWVRMCGPRWRPLLELAGVNPEQEYFHVAPPLTRLVGRYRGDIFDAIADPPEEFRVAAKNRAARWAVETLARRRYEVTWQGAATTVVRAEERWLRLRLCAPDPDNVARLGAQCVARGLYETWVPRGHVAELHEVDLEYPPPRAA
ncbi:hypothetical protein Val02_53380 [Virgisporangium aliadipatigenens]|uniref:LigA protein n=1 Tax=Virgisporangium aliadipatigenens TaxID=741659 RepID=A0A8J3YPZ7_9ACTN|nr:hypothetical protein [Virgisporangium aliadipatigenens]GIJ48452.1 hypothetical protein Val02_53380 [Virgisporangium aliadipatigenens]